MATVEQIDKSATATAQGLIAADAKTTSTFNTQENTSVERGPNF